MSTESDTNAVYDIERLWGSKTYEKVMSYVERGIITLQLGEKIAKKLEKNNNVLGMFIASRSNTSFQFDKHQFEKILENWYQTMKSEKERSDALDKFIKICKDLNLNAVACDLTAMSHYEFTKMEKENRELKEKLASQENNTSDKKTKLEEEIEKLKTEKEEHSNTIKILKEQMLKDKDKQIKEQKNQMVEMKSTLEMHYKLVLYSTDEERRCLGEYEKLTEEKNNDEYEALVKEGTLNRESLNQKIPIFKQKEGNYKLLRKGDIWQVGLDKVSFSAHSPTLFPPHSGWKDDNDEPIPAITVALSGSILCREIDIRLNKDEEKSYREKDEDGNGSDEDSETFESELDEDFLGLFERVENKFSLGRPVFMNKKEKYLAFVRIKPGKGKESYVWAVMDTDTDNWKSEPNGARWFTLFERMGLCPAIKPKEEKKERVVVVVKPAKKHPFKDKNVVLSITCNDHGGALSGQENKKRSRHNSRRLSTASFQSQ